MSGTLIVIEGTDGSGRSTQISLLTEWLESEGFAVQTMGLRRSFLVAEDIDALLAENTVTRMTLALMYGTDFFDQLERRILPALRSGLIVLADRYILHADCARRGARNRPRLSARNLRNGAAAGSDVLAERAARSGVRPRIQEVAHHQLLGIGPRHVAFERLVPVVHSVSVADQEGIRVSFASGTASSSWMAKQRFRGESRTAQADRRSSGIRSTHYQPSHALAHLWR